MRNRTLITLGLILVGIVVIFFVTGRERSIGAPSGGTWQLSEVPQIQLGVRQKLGDIERYTAEFVVIDAKHNKYRVKKDVQDSSWGFVNFPEDFPAEGESGRYTWKCLVGGKAVVGGNFRITMKGLQIGR